MDAPSIAEVPEHELVTLLFAHPGLVDLAVPPETPEPVARRFRVTPSQLNLPKAAFGDIDALLISANDASCASAVEYKRIKVTTRTFHTGQPNKLQELHKACYQVNAAASVGFNRVWLQVIVVIDAREVTGGRFQLIPGIFEIFDLIRDNITFDELHPAVGVHVMHLGQPVDRPVTESGQFGGTVMRRSEPQMQSKTLTKSIEALFARLSGRGDG